MGAGVWEVTEVPIDERARNGVWCTLPYPNHKKGCPNYGKRDTCPPKAPKFEDITKPPYFAVWVTFNLKEHARRMKEKHPKWSERQCRCVLYWQNTVRKRLKELSYMVKEIYEKEYGELIVLEIPEANGINVFKLSKNLPIGPLKVNPDLVIKIMLVAGYAGS